MEFLTKNFFMKQITKPAENKMYSFDSRWVTKQDAAKIAREKNGVKHAYYTKIKEKGNQYWDVRTEN